MTEQPAKREINPLLKFALEMGLRALGLAAADLAVPAEIAGVVTLLAESPRDGQLIFI